jgi:RHS repeat-associated protein
MAGNVKKTWTRRGHLITADYDSRGRDTLQVIPTIGTLRKAYSGPLDQLSRVWVTSLVDSIGGGGSKPDLSFVYDKRGRLKADTAWTGSTAQATRYSTDTFERDSLLTDTLGNWRTKYETTRGLVDTLTTPMLDTLVLSFDHQGRLVADSARSAGLRLTNAMSYTTDGTPKRWSTAMQVPSTWPTGADDQGSQNNALPALQPVWVQTRGLLGAADTLRAGLSYDGWERLRFWDALGSLSGGVSDVYTPDRAGNVSTSSGGELFDATTNRMIRRANGVNRAWRYTYDAAGNLIQAVDSGTSNGTLTYGYDAMNRLVRVAQGATLIARYAYDVLGRRIAKRVYSSATGGTVGFTRFVYHGGQVAFETDSNGAIGTRYFWGPGTDNLVAFRTSAASTDHYYVATDKLGSVHQIIKRDGTWVMSYAYAPYGNLAITFGSGVGLRYRWTGREYDAETGWYFHRARYYDPGQRRFVQEDPAGMNGGDNLYAYVGGKPLQAADPSGLGPDPKFTAWPSDCCAVSSPGGWDGWFGLGGFILKSVTFVVLDGVVIGVIPIPYSQFVTHPGGTITLSDEAIKKEVAGCVSSSTACATTVGSVIATGWQTTITQGSLTGTSFLSGRTTFQPNSASCSLNSCSPLITIDATQFAQNAAQEGVPITWTTVLAHEMGHVAGMFRLWSNGRIPDGTYGANKLAVEAYVDHYYENPVRTDINLRLRLRYPNAPPW